MAPVARCPVASNMKKRVTTKTKFTNISKNYRHGGVAQARRGEPLIFRLDVSKCSEKQVGNIFKKEGSAKTPCSLESWGPKGTLRVNP